MNVVELTGADIVTLIAAFSSLDGDAVYSIKVAIDDIDQAAKFQVNGGTWSPPLGTVVTA